MFENKAIHYLRLVDLLVYWPAAQRPFKPRKAQNIADTFDPDKFGCPIVVALPNGKYHIADGQTRIAAARIALGNDNQKVPCIVVNDCDEQKAASIFIKVNSDRGPPTPLERFQVSVTAREQPYINIAAMLSELSLKVGGSGQEGNVVAAAAVVEIAREHGMDNLSWVFKILQGAWGRDPAAYQSALLRGASLLVRKFSAQLDTARCALALSHVTPGQLLLAARNHASVAIRIANSEAVLEMLVREYNRVRGPKIDIRIPDQKPVPSKSKPKAKAPKVEPINLLQE